MDGMFPDPSAQTSAWTRQLPQLLELLEGLSRRAVEDTNASSLRYLRHLQDIEDRVAIANRTNAESVEEMARLDAMNAHHQEERQALEHALQEAIAFGAVVRAEIAASRQALTSIGETILRMRKELTNVDTIAREIKSLAINATIEAARAGQAGAGFAVIAQAVRALANDTQEITSRIGPLVETAHEQLTGIDGVDRATGDGPRAGETDVGAKLDAQSELLGSVSTAMARLSTEYLQLIKGRQIMAEHHKMDGAELEQAIVAALASAQVGDVIRQQLETVGRGMRSIRLVAATSDHDDETAERLGEILDEFRGSYVMASQHRTHQAIVGGPPAAGDASDPDDTEPTLEFF